MCTEGVLGRAMDVWIERRFQSNGKEEEEELWTSCMWVDFTDITGTVKRP